MQPALESAGLVPGHRLVCRVHPAADRLAGELGPAQALCYRPAVATGLRYSEIQCITPAALSLEGETPPGIPVGTQFAFRDYLTADVLARTVLGATGRAPA